MTAIATLLVVLTISLLTVRVATVMLILTGLSLPLARFQARSAFTGCGYTTGESEQLVGHPVRRRIISTLMLLGNAGIVTTVGALMAGLLAGGGVTQKLERVNNPETNEMEMVLVEEQQGYPLWARIVFLGGRRLVALGGVEQPDGGARHQPHDLQAAQALHVTRGPRLRQPHAPVGRLRHR